MGKFLKAIVFVAALAPASAMAQEPSEAPRIETKSGVSFEKPDGWVEKDGGKGVAVRLEAAGDSKSHIEFRFAPNVDEKKAATFFTSFHSSLQTAGLKKVVATAKKDYGENAGNETQYEMKDKKGASFRLVIWQLHVGSTGWIVIGFFDANEQETLYRDFGKLIGAVAFSK